VTQGVTHKSKFKLTVQIHKFLHCIMMLAQAEHLVDEELKTEVTAWLLQIGLYLKLAFLVPPYVNSLYACHCGKQVF